MIPEARNSLAVTGSKGGVGKSNLAVNLSVWLARWGRKVLLVDGDLGLASLDVLLGLAPHRTVEHLLSGASTIEDLLLEGPGGLRLLPAVSGVPRIGSLDCGARTRLLAALSEASRSTDHLIVDTCAGLSEDSLSLQLAAERVVIVTTPEPGSLVNAYASLKFLWSADPGKRVDLVVNATSGDREARQAFRQVADVAGRFLGREPGFLGAVHHDPLLIDAVKRQRAVVDLYPNSPAAFCYERIALGLAWEQRAGTIADMWRRLSLPATREALQ